MTNVRNIVYCAMLSAILIVSKEFLAMLPNIELVSFLLIMYALHLPYKISITSSIVFCFIQMIMYGIGMWTPMYFVVWPLLVTITYKLRGKLNNSARCALYSGGFGLIFGLLFSIPYCFISITMGIAYFMQGIVYDLIHGICNYIIMTLLYDPMKKVFPNISHHLN